MLDIISALSLKSSSSLKKKDDDWTDRLSSRYTVVLLVAFALFVTMTHLVRNPITCWCPAHFQGGWIEYVNNLCWVNNTYFLTYEEDMHRGEPPQQRFINYYQWIPFILLAQAIFFFVPSVIWHSFNQKAGVDSDDILESAITINSFSSADDDRRNLLIKVITGQLKRTLESYERSKLLASEHKGRVSKFCGLMCGKFGGYLFGLYIISKLCYIGNVFFQLWALKYFFPNFDTLGIDYIMNYDTSLYYETSPIFPRYTLCNFLVRFVGNVQRYTVQCVLPINMVVEKIYVFLWFWMMLVALLSVLSLILWIVKLVNHSTARAFLLNHVCRGRAIGQVENMHVKVNNKVEMKFLLTQVEPFRQVLGVDGYFMLQLIAHNTNVVSTTEIISALFEDWKKHDQPTKFIRIRDKEPLLGNGNHRGSTKSMEKS